jgi:hypothetical protein
MIAKNSEDTAIRIVSIENGKFMLDEQKLLEILTQPNARNKPVKFQSFKRNYPLEKLI